MGGDRGAGARENRGREGYGRRERKGQEAGVLRGRAAGEKYETLIFLIQQCVRILSKTRTQNIRANYNAGLGPDYMRPERTLTGTTQTGTIKFT